MAKIHDWNAIRADYIGGASYVDLEKKYGVNRGSIHRKAQREDWKTKRQQKAQAIENKINDKIANAAAANAVKLEKAKALAIDRITAALEAMPANGGSHARQVLTSGEKRLTVDYDLLDLVTALEKLTRGDAAKTGDEKVTVIIDV